MKKAIAAFCAAGMLLLSACGNQGVETTNDTAADSVAAGDTSTDENIKTFGDIFALKTEHIGSSNTGDSYVYVYEYDGMDYRAAAMLSKEVSDSLSELDFDDPDFDKKVKEVLGPVEVTRFENLTAGIPAQDELDKFVGKTGQFFLDDGYQVSGYSIDDGLDVFMYKGPYSYVVSFDSDITSFDEDDYEYDGVKDAISSIEAKAIVYDGISDTATDMEF